MTMRERLLSGRLACFCFAIVCASSVGSVAETQCTCRSASQSYAVGTCACLDRPGGGSELACCGTVLNNTSWQFTGKSCPIARNEPAASMWMRAVYGDDLDLAPKTALTPRPAHRPFWRTGNDDERGRPPAITLADNRERTFPPYPGPPTRSWPRVPEGPIPMYRRSVLAMKRDPSILICEHATLGTP
jgi:hypothetical protein